MHPILFVFCFVIAIIILFSVLSMANYNGSEEDNKKVIKLSRLLGRLIICAILLPWLLGVYYNVYKLYHPQGWVLDKKERCNE